MKKEIEKKSTTFLSAKNLKNIFKSFKYTFIVFLLILFFNVNYIDEILRFKQFSLFYDIQDEKSTFLFVILKALFVSSFYYLFTSFIN
jgi:hypothetical protein